MTIVTHQLGLPRIGKKRELKFAVESYWRDESSAADLEKVAKAIREANYQAQAGLAYLTSGDFAFYDPTLTLTFALGHLPPRLRQHPNEKTTETDLDRMFRLARGRSRPGQPESFAGEMTKWFNSNYHYIVPEFYQDSTFSPQSQEYIHQFLEARQYKNPVKPMLLGPLSYLFLGKSKDDHDKLSHLPALLAAYAVLLQDLVQAGAEWIQIDEPILAMDLDAAWQMAFQVAYQRLADVKAKLLLTVYFGRVEENSNFIKNLPVAGLHLDALAEGEHLAALLEQQPSDRVLSLGVISGRNIWTADLVKIIDFLEPFAEKYGDRLWLAPNSSLSHIPVSRQSEKNLGEKQNWFAFAEEKIKEIQIIKQGLTQGKAAIAEALAENQAALAQRRAAVKTCHEADLALPESQRQAAFASRYAKQQQALQLPDFPTTTIGSFPQTTEIRQIRKALRQGNISEADYEAAMRAEIAQAIAEQEKLGLDVLVHGEPERNDMVEYFSEHLDGFLLTQHGWVQSYGSRCVKPPVIFGVVQRPEAITVRWSKYAQSLTKKPVKGMLTGPVTMLNWSFVRDDQPLAVTAYQLALAIRQEILDLEAAGIAIIQLDEPALREGLPLRKSDWEHYLTWAVRAFQIAGNGVKDQTQLHTHMCYSEFSDILPAIAALDADVITIETARSDMELLDDFAKFAYPNAIGPGVYDIHSPNVPETKNMLNLMEKALSHLPKERLWVNPDCGLKTRHWPEVKAALANMVSVAKTLREKVQESAGK